MSKRRILQEDDFKLFTNEEIDEIFGDTTDVDLSQIVTDYEGDITNEEIDEILSKI